jgi:hypothetical protein
LWRTVCYQKVSYNKPPNYFPFHAVKPWATKQRKIIH